MAPHAAAARGTALYAPCEDQLNSWPRGRPADGSDADTGRKADGALSQQAAALLEACAEEPDGDLRLALARRAYAAAPTAKKARRAYALALATSKRWGLLADLLEKWDVASTFGDGTVESRAAACGLRFASRYGAAELAAPRATSARRRRPRSAPATRISPWGTSPRRPRRTAAASPSPRTRRSPATAPPCSSPRATFKARWRPTTRPWTRIRPAGGAAGRGRGARAPSLCFSAS